MPKGTEDDDATVCARAPDGLRPLSRKNTDSKLFASALNEQMRLPVEEHAHDIQQGFIRGRNFCRNIAVMDALG
eukprot:400866-Pyramimonas_sp.AAC.1